MSKSSQIRADKEKRTFLIASCVGGGAMGAAGVGGLVSSLQPSERAKAAGGSVELDISALKAGEMLVSEWRGKPIWVVHRSPKMLETLEKLDEQLADPASERDPATYTPKYAQNRHRSIKPEYLIVIGLCTHLGCPPNPKFTAGAQPFLPDDWSGGFFCPCHGSTYDLAARVFKNKPAPDNLILPRHMYLNETTIVVGRDQEGEA